MVKIFIEDALNLEIKSNFGITSAIKPPSFAVRVGVVVEDGKAMESYAETKYCAAKKDVNKCYTCSWESNLDLVDVKADSKICIELIRVFDIVTTKKPDVWSTMTSVRELAEMKDGISEFMLFDRDGNLVAVNHHRDPTMLRLSVDKGSLPNELSDLPPQEKENKFAKHVMMLTRGTRGDLQPFVALARELAENYNWEVTIVTELGYKEKIKQVSQVRAGVIRWRPSGGNTPRKISEKMSQLALKAKITAKQTDNMQKIFLARSEYEFFNSEPAVFHWASTLKPDYLIYGFTMASLAMIASEALNIPLIGFILQPTSIPSCEYPPILPLKHETFVNLSDRDNMKEHSHFKMMKNMMEHVPTIYGTKDNRPIQLELGLDALRERRGLEKFEGNEHNVWQQLLDGNYPLIIPINETMFGGKPKDWSENAVFTDCIFLRGDAVPPIAPDAQNFIDNCKANEGKIVVLAFSSMPVSKEHIVSIALKMIRNCREKVCVFALSGNDTDPLSEKIEVQANEAIDQGRLFIATRAPFGRLFPLVDTVVLHGGLGTTSETLQAQVPAIVTGILLLDQRFWGSRCAKLNVGPFGTHIVDFPDKCVDYVDKALAEDSEWKVNAEKIGKMLTEQAADDPAGVRRNGECVIRMSEKATPFRYIKPEKANPVGDWFHNLSSRRSGEVKETPLEKHSSVRDDFHSDEAYFTFYK
mmetsp:Transcript_49198/g.73149  ORF Transcript_49198/g.73149 Transcript_49198/m.73149 type:complete len:699 (+) Transcript_49198:42-2138(+)|eukprot:CAMPEP_0195520750 /NCGR_PEP_ID=MMETSP0794_2-20130614/17521_1 /TAXON_ID=515487 /ORGANISM="Stephanopyxis turris, Strain CCMP 815" /LENGTH=698 /DNA_ID=CAMNT_0040650169 /DNA_START=28 /DNA_END=2124 /DNA_ORIENTATION=-